VSGNGVPRSSGTRPTKELRQFAANVNRTSIARRAPIRLRSGQAVTCPTERVTLVRNQRERLSLFSVGFGLCLDDVGIGAGVAVKGSNPVVVERIGSQAGHTLTSDIAHIAVLIAGNVITKGTACGDI
jgi:hypothetical protein